MSKTSATTVKLSPRRRRSPKRPTARSPRRVAKRSPKRPARIPKHSAASDPFELLPQVQKLRVSESLLPRLLKEQDQTLADFLKRKFRHDLEDREVNRSIATFALGVDPDQPIRREDLANGYLSATQESFQDAREAYDKESRPKNRAEIKKRYLEKAALFENAAKALYLET